MRALATGAANVSTRAGRVCVADVRDANARGTIGRGAIGRGITAGRTGATTGVAAPISIAIGGATGTSPPR